MLCSHLESDESRARAQWGRTLGLFYSLIGTRNPGGIEEGAIRQSLALVFGRSRGAAALFYRLCGGLEQSPPPPSANETKRGLTYAEEAGPMHRAYAIASILAGVACLEACINELFA